MIHTSNALAVCDSYYTEIFLEIPYDVAQEKNLDVFISPLLQNNCLNIIEINSFNSVDSYNSCYSCK